MRPARPYTCHEITSIFPLAEISSLHTFLIDLIAVLDLHGGIDNRHQMNSFLQKSPDQPFKIRKTLPINREILIPLHIINVKSNGIQGQGKFLIPPGHLFHVFFTAVSPAALLVSKCPERSQVASSDQLAELPDDLKGAFPFDHIKPKIRSFRFNAQSVQTGVSHVKSDDPRIIHKQTKGAPPSHNEKIVCTVHRHCVFMVILFITASALIDPASFVDAPDILPQAIHQIFLPQMNGQSNTLADLCLEVIRKYCSFRHSFFHCACLKGTSKFKSCYHGCSSLFSIAHILP